MKAKIMPPMDSPVLDRDHYYQQVLNGFYEMPCPQKDGNERRATVYVPENSSFNQPTALILIPDQTDAGEFLEKSGWKEEADRDKLYLVFLEPENGMWKKPEEETDYVDSVFRRIGARPLFCPFVPKIYGAGYGEGAAVLQAHALCAPQKWAGILLAGPVGLVKEEAERLKKTPTAVAGVDLGEVQLPVWIAAEEMTQDLEHLVAYLKDANHSGEKRNREDGYVYLPEQGGTVDEHWCAKLCVTEKDWKEVLNPAFCGQVYRELWKGTCRYAGNKNGALRHNGDITERGFRKFVEKVPGGYGDPETDYYCREWWVYEPKQKPENGKFPAVFLFHGAGGSADEIGDRSGWAEVAEEKGILLVCPGASVENVVRTINGNTTNNLFRNRWNTGRAKAECPGDMIFLDYLYQWVMDHYPVDRTRVYATGQSSGGMMAWACAAYRADYFAACAPVSAKNVNKVDTVEPFIEASPIPIMAFLGEDDKVFAGGFATEDAQELIDYWCKRYKTDRQWEDYTYMGSGDRYTCKKGPLTHYVFRTGDGVPMIHLAEVKGKVHAVLPSECRMIWDEWFTRFTKDEDTKILRYDGKEVRI